MSTEQAGVNPNQRTVWCRGVKIFKNINDSTQTEQTIDEEFRLVMDAVKAEWYTVDKLVMWIKILYSSFHAH